MNRQKLKSELAAKGELIVRMDSGVEYELHQHNVDFDGGWLEIETADEVERADLSKVESYRWHFDK